MRKLLLILLLIPIWSQAQEPFQEFETWYRFKANMKIDKGIKAYVAPGLRLTENSTQLKTLFSDFSVSYKVHDFFKPKLNYRYSLRNRYDLGVYSSHRINLDLGTDIDVSEFNFDLRNRTQFDFSFRGRGFANRTKLKVTYDAGEGIEFFSSGEVWLEFGEVEPADKYRFTFGGNVKLKKRNVVSIFYRRQATRSGSVPVQTNVIGMVYRLKLKSIF